MTAQIHFDIEWTDAALKRIKKLLKAPGGKNDGGGTKPGKSAKAASEEEAPRIALPPIECLPIEGDVLFLGPPENQEPFVVSERQYHHEGEADWTIVLILDLPPR